MRETSGLQLRDFDIPARLSFLSGWSPPIHDFDRERSRWQTWAEYLADYEAVRAEFLERHGDRKPSGELHFAERALQFRDDHGIAALEAATYDEVREYGTTDDD